MAVITALIAILVMRDFWGYRGCVRMAAPFGSRKGAEQRILYIVIGAAGFLILLGIMMGVFKPEFILNIAKFAVNAIAAPILNLPFSPVESPYG